MPKIDLFFCDDVREESTGQVSVIGLYGPEVLSTSFPLTLERFCVYLRITVDSGMRPHRIRMTLGLANQAPREIEARLPPLTDQPAFFTKVVLNSNIEFAPLILETPSDFVVHLALDDDPLTEVARLHFIQADE